MDFKSMLQSFDTINEGDVVHKGSYGNKYGKEDVRDQYGHKVGKVDKGAEVQKDAPKKGRGRPKKDGGEESKFDTSALSGVFGGKKPSGKVGTVSKKHSLKEYIESIEAEKSQLDEGEQIEIKPASSTQTQVIQQGNKTLGTVSNPQLANQIKQSIGKGEMTLAGDEELAEVDLGQYDAVKSSPKGGDTTDWDKNFREKLKQYIRELEKRQAEKQGNVAEDKKPDFNDVDNDGDETETWTKAEQDKEKVNESISLSESPETLQHIITRFKHEVKNFINGDELDSDLYDALYDYYSDSGSMPYGTAKGRTGDPFEWITQRFDQDVHQYVVDESTARDFTQHALAQPTNNFKTQGQQPGSMAAPKGAKTEINRPVAEPTPWGTDPIAAATDRAFNFVSSLGKGTKFTKEGTEMKDIQLESWEQQLNGLLTEGITVSSSQGQQGSPDTVSVTASDADAEALLSVLRNAGIGGFGAEPAAPEIGYGVAQGGEEEATGTGTEPQPSPEVVGDDGDMLSMLKKMAGLDGGDAEVVAVSGGDEEGQDYKDEEGGKEEVEEMWGNPYDDDKVDAINAAHPPKAPSPVSSRDPERMGGPAIPAKHHTYDRKAVSSNTPGSDKAAYDQLTGREQMGEDDVEEGNLFTGNLAKARAAGKEEADLDGDGDMEKVKEGEDTCNECGMVESSCGCPHESVEESFANEPNEELAKLKALLGMGNDMHRVKQSQAMGNPVRVAESDTLTQWKKLSGI